MDAEHQPNSPKVASSGPLRRLTWVVPTALLMCVVGIALADLPEEPSEEPTDPSGGSAGAGDTWAATQVGLEPNPPAGGPRQYGDAPSPINIGKLEPSYRETDFTIETGFGPFSFTRSYASSTVAWRFRWNHLEQPPYALPARPFGFSPTGGQSLHWWHNLYSFVSLKAGYVTMEINDYQEVAPRWALRDVEGQLREFTLCEPAPCWAGTQQALETDPVDWGVAKPHAEEKLYYLGADGFILYRPEGRYHYQRRYDYSTYVKRSHRSYSLYTYFLTKIEDGQYPQDGGASRERLHLSYDIPASVPALSVCRKGMPRVQEAHTSINTFLRFNYEEMTSTRTDEPIECVLRSVDLVAAGGATDAGTGSLVHYSYWTPNGVESAGRLAAVSYPQTGRTISYSAGTDASPRWDIAYDGATVSMSSLLADGGSTTAVATPGRTLDVAWDDNTTANGQSLNVTCGPGMMGGSEEQTLCARRQTQHFTDRRATRGDGTFAADVTVKHAFGLRPSYSGPMVESASVQCTGGCAGVPAGVQAEEWQWHEPPQSAPVPTAYKNRRGFWTTYTNTQPTKFPLDAGFEVPQETTQANVAGLRTANFEYDYGSVGQAPRAYEQLVVKTKEASLLPTPAVPQAETYRRHDLATNRLEAVIRRGNTRRLVNGVPSGETILRHVATFYYTYRKCSGETPADADPFGRTLEVQGPCLVSGQNATQCEPPEGTFAPMGPSGPAGSNFKGFVPVTQFEYYDNLPAEGVKANRLKTKRVFPQVNGGDCAGAPSLATSYTNYDARGRLLESSEANGLVSTVSYGRLPNNGPYEKTLSVGGRTTRYVYEGSRLSYVKFPTGHYEVHCYRTGGGVPCAGPPTTQLQWKATMPDVNGASYYEKTEYTYLHGKVDTERVLDSSGVVRRVKRFDADPLGRPTYERTGEGTGAFAITSVFNAEDAPAGLGFAYNAPPAFCSGLTAAEAVVSPLCAALGYDGAGRLQSLLEYSVAGAAPTRTTFTYDAQGRVSRVVPGCALSSGACTSGGTQYVHDDFGNLIEVVAPWTGTSGAPGTLRFEYDAGGNLLRKRTPAMGADEYLEYAYDALKRLLQARRYFRDPEDGATKHEYLYWFEFDAPSSPAPSNCAGANLKGRMVRRNDSFGDSWFSYDIWGSTTSVRRQRTTGAACATSGNTNETPNSSFVYDGFGRLTSEVYPHGRQVFYDYPTGLSEHPDRVKAIRVKGTWKGSEETLPLVSNVQWEPYGGLRAYQVNAYDAPVDPTIAADPQAVEMARAAAVEYLPGDARTQAAASCARGRPTTSDRTGRLRGLWVSTGTLNPPAPWGTGDIFKQTYGWRADQLEQTETCLLSTSASPRTVKHLSATGAAGYDRRLRLNHVSRPPGEFGAAGGTVGRRIYGFEGNGNRNAETRDCWNFSGDYNWSSPGAFGGDRLKSWGVTGSQCAQACGTARLSYTFNYDLDGRVSEKVWPTDSSGSAGYRVAFDAGLHGANDAVGAVYRAVDVDGVGYEYFYDAVGRRRLKAYMEDGLHDEYFYDGDKLLEDRGNAASADADPYTLDEYLWLDGRPVALLRSKLDAGYVRRQDNTADCTRLGETSTPCGAYFIVTDYLKKPVLLLNAQRLVAGTADYEPFGHVNRVTAVADSTNLLSPKAKRVLAYLNQPVAANTSVDIRLRFASVDVPATSGAASAYLTDVWGNRTSNQPDIAWGPEKGAVTTSWIPLAGNGHQQLRYEGWDSLGSSVAGHPYRGLVLADYDYRRYQAGAKPVWTPLRFPGQYHDAETDLFENWNRYYDPSIGRYLGPEPMYQDPKWIMALASAGRSAPAYAYALNNPVGFVDVDGLAPQQRFNSAEEAARDVITWVSRPDSPYDYPRREYGSPIYKELNRSTMKWQYYYVSIREGGSSSVDVSPKKSEGTYAGVDSHTHPINPSTEYGGRDESVARNLGIDRYVFASSRKLFKFEAKYGKELDEEIESGPNKGQKKHEGRWLEWDANRNMWIRPGM